MYLTCHCFMSFLNCFIRQMAAWYIGNRQVAALPKCTSRNIPLLLRANQYNRSSTLDHTNECMYCTIITTCEITLARDVISSNKELLNYQRTTAY